MAVLFPSDSLIFHSALSVLSPLAFLIWPHFLCLHLCSLSPCLQHYTHMHTHIFSSLLLPSVFCLCSLAQCSRHGSGWGLNRRALLWHRAWHWLWSSVTHIQAHKKNVHIYSRHARAGFEATDTEKKLSQKHKHACKYRHVCADLKPPSKPACTHTYTLTHMQASHPSILAPWLD